MSTKLRDVGLLVALGYIVGHLAFCAPQPWRTGDLCSQGWKYSLDAAACLPIVGDPACVPACDSDHRCLINECVPRIRPTPRRYTECINTCGDGKICLNHKCVSPSCKPACEAGFICSEGDCKPATDCHPRCPTGNPCPQNGQCEITCAKKCRLGEACIQGTCRKPCDPACENGFFCQEGKCQKLEDKDGDGYRADRDCNDNDKERNPGHPEVCDNKDNDCDGLVDNVPPSTCYSGPKGTLGVGPCVAGRTTCKDGKTTCEGNVIPSAEVCNNTDDDCNGAVDDGIQCNRELVIETHTLEHQDEHPDGGSPDEKKYEESGPDGNSGERLSQG